MTRRACRNLKTRSQTRWLAIDRAAAKGRPRAGSGAAAPLSRSVSSAWRPVAAPGARGCTVDVRLERENLVRQRRRQQGRQCAEAARRARREPRLGIAQQGRSRRGRVADGAGAVEVAQDLAQRRLRCSASAPRRRGKGRAPGASRAPPQRRPLRATPAPRMPLTHGQYERVTRRGGNGRGRSRLGGRGQGTRGVGARGPRCSARGGSSATSHRCAVTFHHGSCTPASVISPGV